MKPLNYETDSLSDFVRKSGGITYNTERERGKK